MSILSSSLLALAVTAGTHGAADPTGAFIAPVERASFTRLTSHDSLAAFLAGLAGAPGMHVERFATSRNGRVLRAVRVTSPARAAPDTALLRVLLFAQQHGDEPSGMEALTLLLAQLASGQERDVLRFVNLLVVPQMNPDGAAVGRRFAADTVDLNRDHALLTAPEVQGLHALARDWDPHVTLDIHEYASFSRDWTSHGIMKTGDVQLGTLTNPNVPAPLRDVQSGVLLPAIAARMRETGFSFHEYLVGTPGALLRRSTTAINDGRQSFGILGMLSFIQEGRKWRTDTDSLRRRSLAQLAGIRSFLAECGLRAAHIRSLVDDSRRSLTRITDAPIILRMDHRPGPPAPLIPIRDLRSGKDTLWRASPFHGGMESRLAVSAPASYLVRGESRELLGLLARHAIGTRPVTPGSEVMVEQTTITGVEPDTVEGLPIPRPLLRTERMVVVARAGDVLVPLEDRRSLLAILLLEPHSAWGAGGSPEFRGLLTPGTVFPAMRVPRSTPGAGR